MAPITTLSSLLPAELGSEALTSLTGGGCCFGKKLVRGLSLDLFNEAQERGSEKQTHTDGRQLPREAEDNDRQLHREAEDNDGEVAMNANGDALIPGLLDEVALICLAHLPTSDWRSGRQVCSSWRKLFCSRGGLDELTAARQRSGTVENWVFVKSGGASYGGAMWQGFELRRGLKRTLPPMPGQGSRYSWTGAGVVAGGGKLICLGWKDDNIYAFTGSIFPASLSSFLWVYCPVLNRWFEKKGVPAPRTHFACASDGRRLYLVGGRMGGSIMEQGEQLASAWVYHVDQDRWAPIASMCRPSDHGRAVFVGGKLWVVGGPDRAAQVYDPGTDSWQFIEDMWPSANAASLCPLTVYRGSIVTLDVETQVILRYDPAANKWSPLVAVRGFLHPIEGRRRFCSLETDGELLYILGGYLDAACAAYGVNDIEAWSPEGGWEAVKVGCSTRIGSTIASAVVRI